jgi:hypothetical protein
MMGMQAWGRASEPGTPTSNNILSAGVGWASCSVRASIKMHLLLHPAGVKMA